MCSRSCGASCAPCSEDPHGTAGCDGSACTLTCDAGALNCGSTCAVCPSSGVSATACNGTACVASSCADGYALCPSGCCPAFVTETVVNQDASGLSAAIAPDGAFHVSFYSFAAQSVSAASGTSGTFQTTVLDPGATQATSTGVRFDGSGARHIVYWKSTSELLVDHTSGGDATVSALSSGDVVWDVSLATSPVGTIHLAFGASHDSISSSYYALLSPTGWKSGATNAYVVNGFEIPAVCADADDNAHLVETTESLAIEVENPRGTTPVQIATGGSNGDYFARCQIDGQNRMHVIFKDVNNGAHYVRLDGGAVAVDEAVPTWCEAADLALDSSGRPHVVCGGSTGVVMAVRDQSWAITPIDPTPTYGYYNVAIAIDAGDVARLFYGVAGALRYAHPT